jgi:hypothetical protein
MCGAFFDSYFLSLCQSARLIEQKKDPIGIGSFLLSKFESDR